MSQDQKKEYSQEEWSAARENGHEAANEILGAFTKLYPHIAMPLSAWDDLKEMIEREFVGRWLGNDMCALELANDPLYQPGAR